MQDKVVITKPHWSKVKPGRPLTIANLPAPGMTRWVARRKAEVIAAVHGGLFSLEESALMVPSGIAAIPPGGTLAAFLVGLYQCVIELVVVS